MTTTRKAKSQLLGGNDGLQLRQGSLDQATVEMLFGVAGTAIAAIKALTDFRNDQRAKRIREFTSVDYEYQISRLEKKWYQSQNMTEAKAGPLLQNVNELGMDVEEATPKFKANQLAMKTMKDVAKRCEALSIDILEWLEGSGDLTSKWGPSMRQDVDYSQSGAIKA